MRLILLIALVNTLMYYSHSEAWVINYIHIESVLICLCGWHWMKNSNIKGKTVFCILTIYYVWIALVGWMDWSSYPGYFMVETFVFVGLATMQLSKPYNIKSDKINHEHVNLIFYKPVTFKQMFFGTWGFSVASFGAIIGDTLYQFKRNSDVIKRVSYDSKKIKQRYITIDTGYPISKVTNKQIAKLIRQRARQPKTLWLRLNCLRSFRHILKDIKGYEYKGEILPSIYLRRIR
jgi:hypothetical protein